MTLVNFSIGIGVQNFFPIVIQFEEMSQLQLTRQYTMNRHFIKYAPSGSIEGCSKSSDVPAMLVRTCVFLFTPAIENEMTLPQTQTKLPQTVYASILPNLPQTLSLLPQTKVTLPQ